MSGFPRFTLDHQVALVTGAARGLGRSTALALAAAGADIALGLRDGDTGADLADEIRRSAVAPCACRWTSRISPRSAPPSIARSPSFGRIDILINNAGLGPENPAELVTEADFDLTCAVNLKGTFFVSQAVGKSDDRAQGRGRIINLSSQAGFVALPGESIYCMTKAAIAHLTKCLAVEWGPHGITVNAVAPTFILTPGTAPALENAAFKADVIERIAALHRVGEPMDVAGAIVFLASPAASLITGQTLLIDGGWTARWGSAASRSRGACSQCCEDDRAEL